MTPRISHAALASAATAALAAPALAWQIEPVDLTGTAGFTVDLEVGTDGSLHAGYFVSNGPAAYRPNLGQGWRTPIDYDTIEDIALNSSNQPHLLEVVDSIVVGFDGLYFWRYSAPASGVGSNSGRQVVPPPVSSGAQLRFDDFDFAYVAHVDTATRELGLSVGGASGFDTHVVETDDAFRFANSSFEFDIGPNGQAHFIYRNDADEIIHARPTGPSWVPNPTWQIAPIPGITPAPGDFVLPYDMNVDDSGIVHLLYEPFSDLPNTSGLHYARYDNQAWTTERVDGMLGSPTDPKLALGPDDSVNIFTIDTVSGETDLLRRAVQTPTGWAFDTIDSWTNTVSGPEAISPVIDQNGDAHVLYANDSQNIFYAFLEEGLPPTDTALLNPVDDGYSLASSNTIILNTAGTEMYASTSPDRRMIMEFGTDTLPDDAVILSATLLLNAWSLNAPPDPVLEILGYEGNGTVESADLAAVTQPLGTSDPVTGIGPIEITLDRSYLAKLVAEGSILGLLGVSVNGSMVSVDSTEWNGGATQPELTLEYQLLSDLQPGDINLDGTVGTPDLAILAGFFLDSDVSYHEGDLNLDGTVNTADLAILAGFFGEGTSTAFAPKPAAVPEPATLTAAAALAGIMLRRRNRSQR